MSKQFTWTIGGREKAAQTQEAKPKKFNGNSCDHQMKCRGGDSFLHTNKFASVASSLILKTNKWTRGTDSIKML